jgi:hypothetical protein
MTENTVTIDPELRSTPAGQLHSRYVGGRVGFVITTVTPASRYVGGMVGYVS